jgi:hypothetical protein
MIVDLEKEIAKLPDLKKTITEIGRSLWQGRLRKKS